MLNIDYSLRGLLSAFFRQQMKFWLVFLLTFGLGAGYVLRLPAEYAARGSVLVNFQNDALPQITLASPRPHDLSDTEQNELIQASLKILKSQALAQDVIDKIGVQKFYVTGEETQENSSPAQRRQGAISALINRIQVTNDNRSNVIEISVRHEDPSVSQSATQLLIDSFIVRQTALYDPPRTNFLQEQVLEAQRRVASSQGKFQTFKQSVGISDLDAETSQLLEEKRDLSAIAYRAVTEAQQNLSELEAKRAQAAATYLHDSPTINRINLEIKTAKSEVDKRQKNLTENKGSGVLQTRLVQIDQRLSYLEQNRSTYDDMRKQVALDIDNYKYYHQRSEEERINDLLKEKNISRVAVLEKPSLPLLPIPQHRKLMLLAFFMLASLLGVVLAFISELLDDRITSTFQMTEVLGLPVITSIWHTKTLRGSV